MIAMIALYCLVAAILVIALSLREEFDEERGLAEKRKSLAPVINIDAGRRRMGKIHKHA